MSKPPTAPLTPRDSEQAAARSAGRDRPIPYALTDKAVAELAARRAAGGVR